MTCRHQSLVLTQLQVEQELQGTAKKASEMEERRARLKVDEQRLELQLAQAKEGILVIRAGSTTCIPEHDFKADSNAW